MKKEIYEKSGNFFQKKISDIFIFCQPKFDYKQIYGKQNQIIFIEKQINNTSLENYIPCMFYRNKNSQNIMICFHGNSEDIFTTETYALDLRSYLNMNILFVEYPGYSLYMDKNPESKKIFSDSLIVYNWVINNFKVKDDQIFILGRSLGTSPAIYLSSQTKPKALFLVSAFTSMKDIGYSKGVSPFLEKIFNSIKYIGNVNCKILLIHGENDYLIPYQQSENLCNEANKYHNPNNAFFVKRPNMTHNDFDFKNDIIVPIDNFIKTEIQCDNFNINYDTKFSDKFAIPVSIRRIIESKIFNINEFSIFPNKDNNDMYKKEANILIRLFDGRIALSHESNITIYNDRYYKEDDSINLYDEKQHWTKINCLCLLKRDKEDKEDTEDKLMYSTTMKKVIEDEVDKLICSTTSGDIFLIKIYEGCTEKKKIFFPPNNIIYKIEVLNSNEICILTGQFFNVYKVVLKEETKDDIKEDLKLVKSIDNSKYNIINFIRLDYRFAYITSNKFLKFCELENNDLVLIHNIQLNSQKNIYSMAKGYNSLIVGYEKYIEYIDLEDNNYSQKESPNGMSEHEDIISIHRVHNELFLASTDKGSIIQITINENKQIGFIKKTFVKGQINCLLLKNMKNILFTAGNKIWVLSNDKENSKNEDCKVF